MTISGPSVLDMHFTRRLLDRYSSAGLVFVLGWAATGAAVACASDDGDEGAAQEDGGTDAPTPRDDAGAYDAEVPDAPPSRDAAWFDGGPRPVVCDASSSCATSLVTTLGANATDRGEGFCALLDDGTAACWGANRGGQLGRGDDAGALDSAIPARVVGVSNATQLDHTCARDASGGVSCWGTGPFLRNDAGVETTERTAVQLPLPPVRRVAVGAEVACAVVDDGVLCWGRNTNGQLAAPEVIPLSAALLPRRIDLPSGASVRDVVVGRAAFVLRDDGVTVSWGANPPLARVSSLFPDPNPVPIALRGISSLDVTSDSACATAGGTAYCWGAMIPKTGEAINANTPRIDRALPAPVVTPEPVVQIAATRTLTSTELGETIIEPQRWCAVGASGAVYCWGHNTSGQAGDGTKQYAFEAVAVRGLPGPAAQVKATPSATCALLTSGKVYCWGANFYGQLGNGKFKVPSLVPQEVVLP